MTFGVPVHSFPVTYDDELKTRTHLQWLVRRRIKETAIRNGDSFEGIDLPSIKDVLCGRGKSYQEHSGNVHMRNIIAEYIPQYREGTQTDKGRIPLQVVMRIKQEGGRFLRRDTDHGWWFQVSDETAREKISMSFRKSNSVSCLTTDYIQIEYVSKCSVASSEHNSKRVRTG